MSLTKIMYVCVCVCVFSKPPDWLDKINISLFLNQHPEIDRKKKQLKCRSK